MLVSTHMINKSACESVVNGKVVKWLIWEQYNLLQVCLVGCYVVVSAFIIINNYIWNKIVYIYTGLSKWQIHTQIKWYIILQFPHRNAIHMKRTNLHIFYYIAVIAWCEQIMLDSKEAGKKIACRRKLCFWGFSYEICLTCMN